LFCALRKTLNKLEQLHPSEDGNSNIGAHFASFKAVYAGTDSITSLYQIGYLAVKQKKQRVREKLRIPF